MPPAASIRVKARRGSSTMDWNSGGGRRCAGSAIGRRTLPSSARAMQAALARAERLGVVAPVLARAPRRRVPEPPALLAVADGLHPRAPDPEVHQVLPRHLGPPLAQREVVLGRSRARRSCRRCGCAPPGGPSAPSPAVCSFCRLSAVSCAWSNSKWAMGPERMRFSSAVSSALLCVRGLGHRRRGLGHHRRRRRRLGDLLVRTGGQGQRGQPEETGGTAHADLLEGRAAR